MPANQNQGASIEAEREAFEAWHRSKFGTKHSTGQPTRDMHNGIYDENYGPKDQQMMWEVWQAARRTPAAATLDGELPPLPESQANGDNTADFFGRLFKHTDEDMREYGLACFAKGRAQNAEVDDLAMLVRQLVHSLRKAKPDSDLAARAVDYLKRKGLAGSPLRSAEAGAQPDQRESAAVRSREWQPVTGPGQVRKGDKLRFKIGDKAYSERAKLILHAGTDKEEVIYDKGRNFYFITAMVMSGFSNHKCVEVLAASPAAQPVAKDEQKGGNNE